MKAGGPTAAELLERESELEKLAALIDAAVAGDGSVVALEGEAGIGKTSLLACAAHCGGAAGMRVLSARGGELEREFAYGVVRQLFEAPLAAASDDDRTRWLKGAADLAAPVVSATTAQPESGVEQTTILHGLYWLSANLAADEPLLIVIDDAHWADAASIGFVSYLTRRVDELAVLIIYASRIGEGASHELPALVDPAIVGTVLRPDALSAAAAAELVAHALGAPPSMHFAQACHSATNGNPFMLNELLRALRSDEITPEDASTRRVQQIAPRSIARATLARLRQLGPAAIELAFAVAVLGTSAELRYAAALAQLDDARAADAADALIAAAILRSARPLEFIHPIVRTTVYHELAPGRRAAAHKRAARMLARDGAADVALAPHLLATEPSADPWIVERLSAAARDIQEQAPAAACTYLERACIEPPAPSERCGVLFALGQSELMAKPDVAVSRASAVAHLREALDRAPDVHTRFDVARLLAGALTLTGASDDAMKVGYELLAGPAPDDEEVKLRLEGELALMAQFAPRHAKAALERLAGYEGRLTGATPGERLILTCLAFGAAHRGESASATADLARLALGDGKLVDEHRPGSAAMYLAVWTLIYADRLEEAERCFVQAQANARRRGWEGEFAAVEGSRGQVLIRLGRLAEAEADALAVLPTISQGVIARAISLSCLLQTMVERADPASWEPFMTEHRLAGDLREQPMGGLLLYSRGHLRLAAGNAAAALTDFQALQRRDELSGQHTPAIPSRAPQALAYLQLGERDAAQEHAADELARARRWNSPSALAFARRTAGLVAGGDHGIELLRQAVAAVDSSPAALEHARCLTELGAALRRAGHRRDAREPLRNALDLADRCGARRLAQRARDELVASGARPRQAAMRGFDALTPSERRVAQLAADGLTNREIAQALFVTLRTVEGHLTHSYMKLDISSRDELDLALTGRAHRRERERACAAPGPPPFRWTRGV